MMRVDINISEHIHIKVGDPKKSCSFYHGNTVCLRQPWQGLPKSRAQWLISVIYTTSAINFRHLQFIYRVIA